MIIFLVIISIINLLNENVVSCMPAFGETTKSSDHHQTHNMDGKYLLPHEALGCVCGGGRRWWRELIINTVRGRQIIVL